MATPTSPSVFHALLFNLNHAINAGPRQWVCHRSTLARGMNAVSRSLTFIGGILIGLGLIWYPVVQVLCIGSNDGEWGHILRTGKISDSEKFKWGAWVEATDEHRVPSGWPRDGIFQQVRKGTANTVAIFFTAYEAKIENSVGLLETIPVIGPQWGATPRLSPAIATMLVGCLIFIAGVLTKTRKFEG